MTAVILHAVGRLAVQVPAGPGGPLPALAFEFLRSFAPRRVEQVVCYKLNGRGKMARNNFPAVSETDVLFI